MAPQDRFLGRCRPFPMAKAAKCATRCTMNPHSRLQLGSCSHIAEMGRYSSAAAPVLLNSPDESPTDSPSISAVSESNVMMPVLSGHLVPGDWLPFSVISSSGWESIVAPFRLSTGTRRVLQLDAVLTCDQCRSFLWRHTVYRGWKNVARVACCLSSLINAVEGMHIPSTTFALCWTFARL